MTVIRVRSSYSLDGDLDCPRRTCSLGSTGLSSDSDSDDATRCWKARKTPSPESTTSTTSSSMSSLYVPSIPLTPGPRTRPRTLSASFLNLKKRTSAQKYSKVPAVSRLRRVSEWISNTQATRDLWWNKLNEVVSAEAEKEPRATNIQVVYYDVSTNIEYCKTFSVGPEETANNCIQMALDHLEMRGLQPQDFQLWVKTGRDDAPYPLVGHERPAAIKLSCLRDALSTEEGFDLDHCNNLHEPLDPLARCQFILRSARKASTSSTDSKKSGKKNRKSPIRIRQVFRRTLSRSEDSVDSSRGACPGGPTGPAGPGGVSPALPHAPLPSPTSPVAPPQGCLFGVPLQKLCESNGDRLPAPVSAMLQQVFVQGPLTQGIFRRSANARLVRELREQLDVGGELPESAPVLVTAALLKDFLRSMPDSLLGGPKSHLYQQWMDALPLAPQERLARMRAILEQLPRAHQTLLSHFLCVLHHIARRAPINLMSAGNLGVCIGPSVLWSPDHSQSLTRAVPDVVELLVTHCRVLIGPHVVRLLGDGDSGAEESDSLHSGGMLDNLESLEQSLEPMEPSPPPRKDKMSLSRDSGLTMSDSQLYTPDEEESASTSSSGSGRLYALSVRQAKMGLAPAGAPLLREYVRVYGGWEERVQECCRSNYYASRTANLPSAQSVIQARASRAINPNFQRKDWFRQRSALRRLASGPGAVNTSTGPGPGPSGQHATPTRPREMCTARRGFRTCADQRFDERYEMLYGHPSDLMQGRPKNDAADRRERMRRSASEESLLYGDHSTAATRAVLPGVAPTPPAQPRYTMSRSKSAHHLAVTSSPSIQDETYSYARLPERVDTAQEDRSSGHADSIYTVVNGKASEESYESSTLSDDDSTPHVSRSNSRSKESVYGVMIAATGAPPPLPPKLRHLPPVHVDLESSPDRVGRGRSRRRGPKTAQRSKSLPPPPPTASATNGTHPQSPPASLPPPYRHPPSVVPSHRAPITTYYLGARSGGPTSASSSPSAQQHYLDQEESYV